MSRQQNRWFPDGRASGKPRLQSGWTLTDEVWDAERAGGAELVLLRLRPPDSLLLGLSVNASTRRTFVFEGVSDFKLDGQLMLGEVGIGWDVLGTFMLVGSVARVDGRLVYFMELSNAVICFASHRGFEAGGIAGSLADSNA